ncbi:transmembrane protease serine 13-like [Amphiura filiformis]|uniref:transmembrane protease serine 13-like n=1 Tax=Amphiura filiformis TaxID=82378 RepID=UPI003B21E332
MVWKSTCVTFIAFPIFTLSIFGLLKGDGGFLAEKKLKADLIESDRTAAKEVESRSQRHSCPTLRFTCGNGRCVRMSWLCDGLDDCGDSSDEYGCDLFQCKNGLRVPSIWKCDYWNDCGDESDEIGCTCSEFDGQCISNHRCIPVYWYCDGTPDCLDETDETICNNGQTTVQHDLSPVQVMSTIRPKETCEWSNWSDWSTCDTECKSVERSRKRSCSCADESLCEGVSLETDICPSRDCHPEASDGCGTRTLLDYGRRILGGQEASEGSWPWQVQLRRYDHSDGTTQFICGGTLIDDWHVLTAAHCFTANGGDDTRDWYVVLGRHHRDVGGFFSGVTKITMHPAYNTLTLQHDIALVELKQPRNKYAVNINHACLDSKQLLDEEVMCFATGWGTTKYLGGMASVLHEANLPVLDQQSCSSSLVYGSMFADTMLCAGFLNGGIDACQGDSGGPLVCKFRDVSSNNGRWYLMGITSWGIGCGLVNKPGVYTKVQEYIPWIRQQVLLRNADNTFGISLGSGIS